MEDSFEARTMCPKCKLVGEVTLAQVHRDKAKTYSITCRNALCRWDGINWLVDVNPDGSVPIVRPHKKAYPRMPDLTDRIREAADEQIARSMKQDRR